jgi:hypothetical protein
MIIVRPSVWSPENASRSIQLSESKLTCPNLLLVFINPPLVTESSPPLELQFQ